MNDEFPAELTIGLYERIKHLEKLVVILLGVIAVLSGVIIGMLL